MRSNFITRYLHRVARSLGMGQPKASLKSVNLRGIQPNGSGRIKANGEALYIAKIGGFYFMGTFSRCQLGGDSLYFDTHDGEGFWLGGPYNDRPSVKWCKLWEFIDDGR